MAIYTSFLSILLVGMLASAVSPQAGRDVVWKHLSSKAGDIEPPNNGKQQCSATVFDIDRDGVNDFVITERTRTPSVVWYRRSSTGWKKYVIDDTHTTIEAGATFFDVDGDGDLDFVAAGDYQSNEIFWYENPCPDFAPDVPWKRHVIKNSGGKKHHDIMFADVDGDGKLELIFWNQGANGLFLARVPPDPRSSGPWPYTQIYSYSTDSEPEQRGIAEPFKGINEHEGLSAVDIDGDGKLDIVGGGRWFKHIKGNEFQENLIDPSYPFSRAAAGILKKGAVRPQVIFVVGDGRGPMVWYEWVKGTWHPHKIMDVDSAHSLQLLDFDGDGNLDIFCAEMRLNGRDPEARLFILFGSGNGNFERQIVAQGIGLHESRMADLDGNGTLDILGKPYDFDTPRLDIWLNMGSRK